MKTEPQEKNPFSWRSKHMRSWARKAMRTLGKGDLSHQTVKALILSLLSPYGESDEPTTQQEDEA